MTEGARPSPRSEDGSQHGLGLGIGLRLDPGLGLDPPARPETSAAPGGGSPCNGIAGPVLDDASRTAPSHALSSLRSDREPHPPSSFAPDQVQFRSHTIAPSPPLSRSPPPFSASSAAPGSSRSSARAPRAAAALHHAALRLQTDIQGAAAGAAAATDHLPASAVPCTPRQRPESSVADPPTSPAAGFTPPASSYIRPSTRALQHKSSSASLQPVSRTPSLKTAGHSHYALGTASSASSTVPSPIITAMGDVTPLPSPLLSGDSPGPWRKLGRSPPSDAPVFVPAGTAGSALTPANGDSLTAAAVARNARGKAYADLGAGTPGPPDAAPASAGPASAGQRPAHTRDRSLSEYVPDPVPLPKRMVTVSATHARLHAGPGRVDASSYEAATAAAAAAAAAASGPSSSRMRREPHLSEARGLTPTQKPPTPPPSESSLLMGDGAVASEQAQPNHVRKQQDECFEAFGKDDHKRRRWRSIKLLGQGTFSRVMLATNQVAPGPDDAAETAPAAAQQAPGPSTDPAQLPHYDRRTLVAVKVCEHGPKGGASEDRIEMSLKRELEIMQSIHHPSLVRLKAWNIEPTRAILVLSYCPGGDLFDLASTHRSLLTPPLLARIFAELVGAVRHLHTMHIVHRDIKLENVLVNLTPQELADPSVDWAAYPYSITTLTDLGLSRRVADDEKLETRCGSDDYAAPEVIMGQPYDGRATDAWSLGVLLYALLEGRLPFDPNPGMSDAHRMRSRTSHRIARVEWRWIEFAGDDGEHEGDVSRFRARGLVGAMEIVEGLLKRARSRWTLDKVADVAWVRDALAVPGGLRFREEEEGEEIS